MRKKKKLIIQAMVAEMRIQGYSGISEKARELAVSALRNIPLAPAPCIVTPIYLSSFLEAITGLIDEAPFDDVYHLTRIMHAEAIAASLASDMRRTA